MEIETLTSLLGWCSIINMGILLWWFAFFMFAHDWVYNFHDRWFKISKERFDEIHYMAIAFYKLAIFLLNIVPYLALKIIT
jgi:hypothetical protein